MNSINGMDLTEQENQILRLYAMGKEYEEIIQTLFEEFGEKFNNRTLGYKMGAIKKKLDCKTQFQVGYQYSHKEFQSIVESLKDQHDIVLKKAEVKYFSDGYKKGHDESLTRIQSNETSFGIIMGVLFTTVFWLFFYYFIIK